MITLSSLLYVQNVHHFTNWKVVQGWLEVRLSQTFVPGIKAFTKGRNRECGTPLARKVILGSGKVCFYPHKLYCFNSVIDQIEGLLKRPGIPEMREQWREHEVEDNIMADIYDGSIWRDFLKYKGNDFLNAPRNLAFAINVDWFQPFKRRNDRSVGAIYLVLLNLPREQRFKWENIIVAGIIPEMSKEPKSLNTFLSPIVAESSRHNGKVLNL